MSEAVKETALEILPLIRPKKGRFLKDCTLKQMTVKSKVIWKAWSDAGRPSEGPLHDSKLFCRREVRKRINVCATMAERRRVSRTEQMFKSNDKNRFRIPNRKKSHCSKLRIGSNLITNKKEWLNVWSDRFRGICKSKIGDNIKEYLLDTPFTLEEVENAVHKLKPGKASGCDGLIGEHLIHGGQTYCPCSEKY